MASFSGDSEFCNVATKIHIYTQEEVEKMTVGITGDDTQSCLDQALWLWKHPSLHQWASQIVRQQ